MSGLHIAIAVLAIVGIVALAIKLLKPISPERFSAMVRSRIESNHPDVKVKEAIGFGWKCEVGGQDIDFYLDNAYGVYLRNRRSLYEIIDRYTSNLACLSDDEDMDWAETKRRIFPSIRPDEYFESIRQMDKAGDMSDNLVTFDYAEGLKTLILVDAETSMCSLRKDNLNKWGITPQEAFDQAMNNLAVKTGPLWVSAGEEARDTGIFMFASSDGYDAARILLPDLGERACRALECSKIAVAIPIRDMLVAVPADRPEAVEGLRKMAQDVCKSNQYSVSPNLFFIGGEEGR